MPQEVLYTHNCWQWIHEHLIQVQIRHVDQTKNHKIEKHNQEYHQLNEYHVDQSKGTMM